MNWLEITVNTQPEKLDELCEQLELLGVEGLIIEDESFVRDFVQTSCNTWEHVEEDVFDSVRGICRVRFFLENSEAGEAELCKLSQELNKLGLLEKLSEQSELSKQNESYQSALIVKKVQDEDWENNWRQYYKPIASGERLVIVPAWEAVPPEFSNRAALHLDPKQAFGNGSHASTRLCLEMLEHYLPAQKPAHIPAHVLDIGCGSGILSIAALLLGAKTAVACDIVSGTAEIVSANAVLNGLAPDAIPVHEGDVLNNTELRAVLGKNKYDLIFANIIADVIIPLIPIAAPFLAPDGVLICSGIFDGRQGDIENTLTAHGFYIDEAQRIENWHAFACKRLYM